MNFAKRVFMISGLYGFVALLPQYFLEQKIGIDTPPAITHPEYFYGFVGVGFAWQVLFLMIAKDPVRLRPAMLPGALEKIAFGVAAVVLIYQGRSPEKILPFALIDFMLAGLFLASYARTPAN